MFRRFLRHKIIRDKDLLLTFPKPPLFPRLLPRTSVGNVRLRHISPEISLTTDSQKNRAPGVRIESSNKAGTPPPAARSTQHHRRLGRIGQRPPAPVRVCLLTAPEPIR